MSAGGGIHAAAPKAPESVLRRPGLKPPISRVVVRAVPAAHTAKAAAGEPPTKRQKAAGGAAAAAAEPGPSSSDDGGGGLAGLLGDYGSDSSDSDGDGDGGGAQVVSATEQGAKGAAGQAAAGQPAAPAVGASAAQGKQQNLADEDRLDDQDELLDFE